MRLLSLLCTTIVYFILKVSCQDTILPFYETVPDTAFSCKDRIYGYYADLEVNCQVFHVCQNGRKWSFLCPNQTVFNQDVLVCDYPDAVNCPNSEQLYAINERLGQTGVPLKD